MSVPKLSEINIFDKLTSSLAKWVECWFNPRPHHTKDFKNSTRYLRNIRYISKGKVEQSRKRRSALSNLNEI